MKHFSVKLILLFINIYSVMCAVPGCFESSTGCYTYCSKNTGSCYTPFKSITETGSNGGNICYCYRPYTKEEINSLTKDNCADYSYQCLTFEISDTSCSLAHQYCDVQKWSELCNRAKDIGHERAVESCDYINNPPDINFY